MPLFGLYMYEIYFMYVTE